MMKLCPQCGADLCIDEPLERGAIRMAPYGSASWNGTPVHLTAQQVAILYALLKADGAPLSRNAIAERIGCESDDPDNVISVQVCRMRSRFAEIGGVLPVEIVRGIGLRWAA